MRRSENQGPSIPRLVSSVLTAAALVWSISIGWRIWTTPVRYQTIAWRTNARGQTEREDGFVFRSFREVSGLGAVPLLVPAALAGLAFVAAVRGYGVVVATSALLFLLFAFVTGFSIGGAYKAPGVLLSVASLVSIVDRARSG